MTKREGVEMRSYLQKEEMMKSSAIRLANKYKQTKLKEVDAEYMQRFEGTSPLNLTERAKTEEEATIEELVKNYK